MTPEKLEFLTPEQEQKMNDVAQYWINYIDSCKNSINQKQADIQIEWLYRFCGLDEPIVIYMDSPIECQYAANILKEIFDGDDLTAKVWDKVWAKVVDKVVDKVRDKVWAKVVDKVGDKVRDKVGDKVRAKVRDNQLDWFDFAWNGSVVDYGWVSFYDFFTQVGVLSGDDVTDFNEFKKLLECGIYDTIQLNGFCIVSDMPTKLIRNKRDELHCEDGPAIEFRDGYSEYYWNGVSVPSFWITDKNKITKKVIIQESNAELRRCLREIIGPTQYFNLLGGVIVVDTDTDDKGNEMTLYRSKEIDTIVNKYIQYISVICPSTNREYILYPPNQDSKNVWEAKASTFRNEKIQIRHGDVGLLNLGKEYKKPVLES